MKIAARFSMLALGVSTSAQTRSPGQGVSAVKVIRSSLWACCTPAVLRFSRIIWGSFFCPVLDSFFLQPVDQFVVLVHAEHAVRAEALHGKGSGDADFLVVGVGPIVEELVLGLGRDGGVDLSSAGRCGPATIRHAVLGRWPSCFCLAGNLPFLPCFLSAAFSFSRNGSSVDLPLVPDDIDFRVVGDGLERDVRHALIDEAVADVSCTGCELGAVRVTSASLSWPSRESASR